MLRQSKLTDFMLLLKPQNWSKIAPPGGRLFLGSGAACPHALIREMLANQKRLRDIELVHITTLGPTPWVEPEARAVFRTNSFFLSGGVREAVNAGEADYTPCFLSEVPALFRKGVMPLDAALIMVSPPDARGLCTLGVSVDVIVAAIKAARTIVAQINPCMPRTHGKSELSIEQIDYCYEAEEALPEWLPRGDAATADKVAAYVAQLVDDGATLQLGIGNVPDRICRALRNHKHLGLHTELMGDGVRELMECGALDNSRKPINTGLSVASFCRGSRALYDFVDDNYQLSFRPTDYTNNIAVIAQHPNMVAINSAVEVDVTGQAAADTVEGKFYSGIGGLIDFTRGAAMSEGGLPILALPSTAKDGSVSRIVSDLSPGAGVVCSRADVHFVVTEYGIATLRGRSIRERVLELVQVAHPKFREALLRQARERKLIAAYETLVPHPVRAIEGVEIERLELGGKPFVLRPLHPSDERRLQEFFYSHDADTIQRRYGYEVASMTGSRAHELTGVDQERDLALGIFEVQGALQRIHAVGRYFLDPDGQSAECAFVVGERKRRIGMGRVLFERMIALARKRGLARLWAVVSSTNEPMLKLFEEYGSSIKRINDDPNSCEVTLLLDKVKSFKGN